MAYDDVPVGVPSVGPPRTRPRLPPQALPVDRSGSSATLTERSGVEAAKLASWADPTTLPPWVLQFV